MGYAAMMKDRMLGDINPEQERALAKITERSNNLLGMINSILHVTSLEARTTLVESYEVDLPDLLNELKEDYQSAAPETVELFWNDFPDLPVIRTDGRKLKHILQNVIGNALKFTEQGSVTVSTRHVAAENKVEFEVADTGIGIPKEMMPVIFDKFLQADGSQTRRYEGLGLGLYIVKQFAELLGGTVEVKSHAGKGSTFTVRLPYASCR